MGLTDMTISCRYHDGNYGLEGSIEVFKPKMLEEFTDYTDRKIDTAMELEKSFYQVPNPSFWIVCRIVDGKWVPKKKISRNLKYQEFSYSMNKGTPLTELGIQDGDTLIAVRHSTTDENQEV